MSVDVKPIVRGDDWEWTHEVTLENGSTIQGCRISMTWKYDAEDPDSQAAAKITSDPNGGITILTDASFACIVPHAVTATIKPGDLVVDIQYETPTGKVKTEKGLSRQTKCTFDVTRDVAS